MLGRSLDAALWAAAIGEVRAVARRGFPGRWPGLVYFGALPLVRKDGWVWGLIMVSGEFGNDGWGRGLAFFGGESEVDLPSFQDWVLWGRLPGV